MKWASRRLRSTSHYPFAQCFVPHQKNPAAVPNLVSESIYWIVKSLYEGQVISWTWVNLVYRVSGSIYNFFQERILQYLLHKKPWNWLMHLLVNHIRCWHTHWRIRPTSRFGFLNQRDFSCTKWNMWSKKRNVHCKSDSPVALCVHLQSDSLRIGRCFAKKLSLVLHMLMPTYTESWALNLYI